MKIHLSPFCIMIIKIMPNIEAEPIYKSIGAVSADLLVDQPIDTFGLQEATDQTRLVYTRPEGHYRIQLRDIQ